MRTRVFAVSLCLFTGLAAAAPAEAQYGARRTTSNRATGETYHVEVAGTIWNPTPDIVISSEGLGQNGDPVDFVTGFQLEGLTYGRPVGVSVDPRGALIVADDLSNTVWRVTPAR